MHQPKGRYLALRSVIADRLWIAGFLEAQDIAAVLSLGVRAVIDLAANEPPLRFPRDIACCRLPLGDGAGNDPAIVRLAVASAVELIRSGVPTLIACSGGLSRSPAIASAAIALIEQRPPDEVLLEITRGGPHDVSPAFWAEVKRLVVA